MNRMIIRKYRESSSRKERKAFNRSFARARYAMHIICEIEDFLCAELRKDDNAIRKFERDILLIKSLLSEESYAQLCLDDSDFAAANRAYNELIKLR